MQLAHYKSGLGQGVMEYCSDGLVCHEQGEGEEYKYNLFGFYNALLQYSMYVA